MAIDPFTRRTIIGLAEAKLHAADVVDVLPTPLERVAEVAGVAEIVAIDDIPDDLVASKPNALKRILGAYLYKSNTAFVDLSQPTGRRRFILAHETGHKIVPWHEDSHHLDDEIRLFRDSEEELEEEANLAGTLLMFQGARFHQRALDFENSLRTPIALSDEYGASMHASIWYYTEHHPEPVALIIAGQHARADGTVPVWHSVQSRTFTERFGSIRQWLPARGVPIERSDHPLCAATSAAFSTSEVTTDTVVVPDLRGGYVRCSVDTFFNQRCLFVMITPKRALRRGRRVIVRAG